MSTPRKTRAERDAELWLRYEELDGKTQQNLRIRQNLRDAGGVENLTIADLDDVFEDRDPFEFL